MRPSSRRLVAAAAIVGPIVFAACTGPQSALEPESPAARDVAGLWWVMLAVSAVVFAVVVMLVVWASLRRTEGQVGWLGRRGTRLVTIGGVMVPAVILAALFAATLATLPSVSAPGPGDARMVVEVIGRRWFWDVRYPGLGFTTANEIHIPAGVPVELRVTTRDVIHSFWVPRLNRKIDMIPGRTGRILLQADRPGVYRGQCAEFCGLAHAQMAFRVVADEPDDFEAWAEGQRQPAGEPATESARFGREVFLSSACIACHTVRGTAASATVGPDLTHVASRDTLAAGTIPNTRGYLAGWIVDPDSIKPGNLMPRNELSGPQLQALLDYLESLE